MLLNHGDMRRHDTVLRIDTMNGWLITPRARQLAPLRLFCFPYAGGGASIYRPWAEQLPAWVELVCVQPPGRESRLRERAHTRLEALLAELVEVIRGELERPFAFYGHSMGALIAFELTRLLARRQLPLPRLVVLGGRHASHVPDDEPVRHVLPDAELVESLREMNGIPDVALQHPEMMELVLPTLRADLELCETHPHVPGPPLPVPLCAYGGTKDRVRQSALEAWRLHTRADFTLRMFGGDHFFLRSHRDEVLRALSGDLLAVTPPGSPGPMPPRARDVPGVG
nr:Type II thioesterase [Corallococcus coralloides]